MSNATKFKRETTSTFTLPVEETPTYRDAKEVPANFMPTFSGGSPRTFGEKVGEYVIQVDRVSYKVKDAENNILSVFVEYTNPKTEAAKRVYLSGELAALAWNNRDNVPFTALMKVGEGTPTAQKYLNPRTGLEEVRASILNPVTAFEVGEFEEQPDEK